MTRVERCCICDQPTGKAGKAEDSLYLEDGTGPYCDECCDTITLANLTPDIWVNALWQRTQEKEGRQ